MIKNFIKIIVNLPLLIIVLGVIYLGLFYNNASQNVALIKEFNLPNLIIIINLLLVLLIIPTSLAMMKIITGELGLERFKRIFAISLGMTTLSFAVLQFISAIATSSAEGSTVLVEVIQQVTHFVQTGELEEYGLVGMLTSDASGPWNSAIFPMIILFIWLLRGKATEVELRQLHIPMIFQFILYAQQFFFALDLRYTLLEIILMGITGSVFIWGMVGFLFNAFRKAEKQEAASLEYAQKHYSTGKPRFDNFYTVLINRLAWRFFRLLTFTPWHGEVAAAESSVTDKRGGYGRVKTGHVVTNGLQLTITMTVAMFALVLSTQFLFNQLRMSDAEAALFGTAGLTSAPEALVALGAGPYLNMLLLVGSNVIDGWMSSIGQFFLLGFAEISSNGAITHIPLHPAISNLTLLSWTQGIVVWSILTYYSKSVSKRFKQSTVVAIVGLALANLYYFGGAWISAQALGYGADYARNTFFFINMNILIDFLSDIRAQQIVLIINVIGLIIMMMRYANIRAYFTKRNQKSIIKDYRQRLDDLKYKFKVREDQQVIIALDQSKSMDEESKLFSSGWLNLIFRQIADIGLLLDDDGHIHVYTFNADSNKHLSNLLSTKNKLNYIDRFVSVKTTGKSGYEGIVNEIYREYHDRLTPRHDPVLAIIITRGMSGELQQVGKLLEKYKQDPIFFSFMVITGAESSKGQPLLKAYLRSELINLPNISVNPIPFYSLTKQEEIARSVLSEYEIFLDNHYKINN